MISTKFEFPHPLLSEGRDDYTTGSFILNEGDHKASDSEFIFSFAFELNCPGLENYISQGKADVILFVSSSAAKFRKRYKFSTGVSTMTVRIAKDSLVKRVEFTAYIISAGDDNFRLLEHNADYYGNTEFRLRKGDILAESATIAISLDDSELQKPLSSIFQIAEANETATEAIEPHFETDKIEIYLLPEIYKKYATLRQNHASLRRNLSAVITLPVLVEAIELMRTEDTEDKNNYQNLRWYLALSNRLAQHNINIEDPTLKATTIANKIYGNLVFDALDTIQDKLDAFTNSEIQEIGGID